MDWGFVVLITLAISGAALIVGGIIAFRGSSRTGVRAFGAAGAAAGIVMWAIVLLTFPVSSSDDKSPAPIVGMVAAQSTITEESFLTLLTEEDVRAGLTAEAPLKTRFSDYKDRAGGDPAKPENIESWYSLDFDAADGSRGMSFLAIDFDSTASARDHFEKMMSEMKSEVFPGMREMVPPIGDASLEVEVDAKGIGSILVFVNGDILVSLTTWQPDDQEPLLTLEGLEELAELVASRL